MGRPYILVAALAVVLLIALLGALAIGSVDLPQGWWLNQPANWDATSRTIILELRLPRAGVAVLCGGMLGLAGVLMQVLLRNPLADPYILGVSSGAAFAALLTMLIGMGSWSAPAAFVGALLSMSIVFVLARGPGHWTPLRLLLTGVIVAAAWSAGISFILAIAPDGTVRDMLFWLMGDLANSHWSNAAAGLLIVALLAATLLGRNLNLLATGELRARTLGVPIARLRILLYLLGSLLAAAAVSIAGSIGFVGLVVPHALRLLGARDHRVLVPASVLGGAILLLVADTLARTLIAPQQLPVGVLTALIGAPIFLYLLYRGQRRIASP